MDSIVSFLHVSGLLWNKPKVRGVWLSGTALRRIPPPIPAKNKRSQLIYIGTWHTVDTLQTPEICDYWSHHDPIPPRPHPALLIFEACIVGQVRLRGYENTRRPAGGVFCSHILLQQFFYDGRNGPAFFWSSEGVHKNQAAPYAWPPQKPRMLKI